MQAQQKRMKNGRILLFVLGILSCLIIMSLLIYLVMLSQFFSSSSSPSSDEPGYISTTKDFLERMTESLDIVEVREWMNSLTDYEISKVLGQQYIVASFPIKLPTAINRLNREMSYIYIFNNDQNNICICMTWGGPVTHWGVVIGPKDMPIPPTVDVSYDEHGFRNMGEYRIKLADGAYVWHNIK